MAVKVLCAFFQPNATLEDDQVSGGVLLFFSMCALFLSLMGFILIVQRILLGISMRIVYKATDVNGYMGICMGCGITSVIQSSSITTSTLTPLAGMGILSFEHMFALTLGANLGTTLTALTAAMVVSRNGSDSLQAALVHVFFNVTGIFDILSHPLHAQHSVACSTAVRKHNARVARFPIFLHYRHGLCHTIAGTRHFTVLCQTAVGIFRVGFFSHLFTHAGFLVDHVLLSLSQRPGTLFALCPTTRTTECSRAAFTGRHGTFATASCYVTGTCGDKSDGATTKPGLRRR